MHHPILVLIVLMFSAAPLFAQTPEQVAITYFEKLKTGGINTIAALMHPDELRKFREMLTPVVEGGLASVRDRETFQPFADPKNPAFWPGVEFALGLGGG
jgi:hypothetical protein